MDIEWEKLINHFKKRYEKIGQINCPALANAPVHFDNHGLSHFFFKQGKPRPLDDQKRRFHLFKRVPLIVAVSRACSCYRRGKHEAEFWELTWKNDLEIIQVVIRRINKGEFHFYSVKGKRTGKRINTKGPEEPFGGQSEEGPLYPSTPLQQ